MNWWWCTNNPDNNVLILDRPPPGRAHVAVLLFCVAQEPQQVVTVLVCFWGFGLDLGADSEEDYFGDCRCGHSGSRVLDLTGLDWLGLVA
jgi:hypothetical protein